MIKVEGLSKEYKIHEKEAGFVGSLQALFNRKHKIVTAVDNVSFSLAEGEIVGFLGSNGAGKTTTLKMLSGLLHPTKGKVLVNGFEPKRRQKEFLKSITLVMGQKQQLTWDLAAIDSFLVNQAIYEIEDKEYKTRLAELTDMLELSGLLNKQVRKLSLGERMKCELAAALLHQPKILFLDEPTIGLDVNMQLIVRNFIKDYNARYNATIMLTSHYMADVTALAKRIMVIDKGKLIFDGDFKKLIEEKSPKKILKLELKTPTDDRTMEKYGELRSNEGIKSELLVDRAMVTKIAAKLLNEIEIVDISIEEIPVEEIIGEIFDSQKEAVIH